MKQQSNLLPLSILMGVLFLGLLGCSDHQSRYDDPPWLGGSSIETLKKQGNYTIFLRLMQLANYEKPIEKQLFTLFVPNDEIFQQYLNEQGLDSIGSLTHDEAVQLFTLHVLRNPRSRYQLIYEYVWSEEQGPDGEYAGLFFRKPTPSTSTPYPEHVDYYSDLLDKDITIYTGDKLVPLFSLDYFEDFFGATDGSDYLFMYPGSNWDNTSSIKSKAMNWHNAMVLPNPDNEEELEVRTASGFIFYIDQVVPPMPSIEEYLRANKETYSLYYDILQRFAKYGNTRINDKKEVEYRKSYDLVLDLAEERGPNTGNENQMKDMFTAFIPNNATLQSYLDQKVLKTYGEIDSVPRITLFYILQTQLSRSLGLISKLEKSYFNAFGDPTVIDRNFIKSAYMCSNGLLYQTDKVLEPNVFTCVPGNLFFDKNYSTFLYALNAANMLTSLSNLSQKVTLFAPSNELMEAYNIRYNTIKTTIEYKGQDKTWKNMKTDDLMMFVQDHIYDGEITDFSGEQYIEMSSGNYIHISNNKISGPQNEFIGDDVSILETIPNEKNGVLLNVNNVIKGRHTLGKEIWRDPNLSKFAALLDQTRLLNRRFVESTTRDTIPFLKFFSETSKWTAFIPSNAAMEIAEAAGEIPSNSTELKNWILYHFVRNKVIFDDGNPDGTGVFQSNQLAPSTPDGPKYSPLTIKNNYHDLTVTDHSGQVVKVEHANANALAKQSVVHTINAVLKY